MGVELFDRSARQPTLTAAGTVLLEDTRAVISGVDEMKTRADALAAGVEPELSAAVDGAFPMEALAQATSAVRARVSGRRDSLVSEGVGGAYKPDCRVATQRAGGLPSVCAAGPAGRWFIEHLRDFFQQSREPAVTQ